MKTNNKHIKEINEMLKEVLRFYANKNNYKNGKIELDKGHQANYILEVTQKINNEILGAEEEYMKLINKEDDKELINEIEKLKKLSKK